MPETSTAPAAPQAPAVARLPLTGEEARDTAARYVAARLCDASGPLPDGSPRFIVQGFAVVHAPSGLAFKLQRNTAPASSGITPYFIECSAERQAIPGSPGAPLPAVLVKLHANGEARWSRIIDAANAFEVRKREAAERNRLCLEREALAWAALRAFLAGSDSGLPPPTATTASPDTTPRAWRWDLPVRASRVVPYVSVSALLGEWNPSSAEPFDLHRHGRATIGLALGRSNPTWHTVTLREAVAFVKAMHVAADAWRADLTPSEVAPRDPHLCPSCGSGNTGPAYDAARHGPHPTRRLCVQCDHCYETAA